MTGLNMTIFLLAIYRKALPALPISIAFGIAFYFLSSRMLTPFINGLIVIRPLSTDGVFEGLLRVGKNGGGLIYV
jgi:presenilin 1